jgi:3-hydroxybutyryl-CoA dehydrogenase
MALVAKGKLMCRSRSSSAGAHRPLSQRWQAATSGLVVEAIVENLAVKRGLFQQLEAIVAPDCVLATNTSSISVTAIANGLQHPGGWSACTSSTRCR